MTVLKWAWVYGSLRCDEYEDLDDAVDAAQSASDYGDESLACLEVLGEGARTIEPFEVWRLHEERNPYVPIPKTEMPTHVVQIRPPEGYANDRWGRIEWAHSAVQASALAEPWIKMLGADRVKVTRN